MGEQCSRISVLESKCTAMLLLLGAGMSADVSNNCLQATAYGSMQTRGCSAKGASALKRYVLVLHKCTSAAQQWHPRCSSTRGCVHSAG
eukprot:scaffold311721_cov24-Tisochrysis_lutea.AAC.2